MTEPEQAKSGWGVGCVIAAVLGFVILGVGGAAALWMSSGEAVPPSQDDVKVATDIAKSKPPPPAVNPQLMSTPGKAVTVKLTALGEGGTWYTIDEDICEGDALLTATLQDRIARDKAARGNPADYSYPVRFEVVSGAGVGAAHVAAARKAAEAAGASVVEDGKP